MTRRTEGIDKIVEAHLDHLGTFDSPPAEDVARSSERTLDRLLTRAATTRRPAVVHSSRTDWTWRPVSFAAAAVIVIASVGAAIMWHPGENALYRVVEGKVSQGETIRANGEAGAVLALPDGSRIEMRAQSELSVEHGDDGMRIRLRKGGIIVNAAKQRTGHLYVETKDMTVSVVGTVFLVNVGDNGSRVAVIEGEVHVQQGGTAKKLLPGEQVSTNPLMETPTVSDGIAWSRQSTAFLALLQQSAVVRPEPAPEPRDVFEVASIRPRQAPAGGGRGTGGSPCAGLGQIDPQRFVVTNTTLHNLIAWAHGKDCFGDAEFISGGPDWIRSYRFDLEARMPEGFPSYTMIQVRSGNAPRLQPLLQAMLADRFKLMLRRGMKERSVYILTATAKPTLTAWKEEDGEGGLASISGPSGLNGPFARLMARKVSMARLADALGMPPATGQRVLDRTGIVGEFNIDIRFVPNEAFVAMVERETGAAPAFASGPSLSTALEEQLGLRLESIRASVETLTVERAEKPTEN
ncbi:MAG: TIGR03435 family protein [Vicinamibacterales bacterium]